VHRQRRPEDKPDTPEILDQTHVALRRMLIDKEIPEEVYAKNIVALAARWIILRRMEDANAMICELTDEYITQDLPVQMQTDDNFREVANMVSERLSEMPMDLDDDDVQLASLMVEKPTAKA
jgi:hypothetical protein